MTTVVNKRTHAATPFDTYIGRPSMWGNPFIMPADGDRATVIRKYEDWIKGRPDLLRKLPSLRGRNLVCYCAPLSCHGDVLKRLCEEIAPTPAPGGPERAGRA